MSRKCDLLGIGPMSGNNVSHAKNRTLRRFMPNLQTMRYFSSILSSYVRLRVCTSTNRTIISKGGFDAFLLSTDSRRLTDKGVKMKKMILKRVNPEDNMTIRR